MGVTCDGNSANQLFFFNLHSKENKVKNPFTSEDWPIFFLVRSSSSDEDHSALLGKSQAESLGKQYLSIDFDFLCGLAEWEFKGDYVEAPDGFLQGMCWSKHNTPGLTILP